MPSLPMTQSAAQALISEYSKVITGAMEDNKYSITTLRENLKKTENEVIDTAKKVYSLFNIDGIDGSSLDNIEAIINFENLLNERIKSLKATSDNILNIGNLNGPELERNFLINYQQALPFDRDMQNLWEDWLKRASGVEKNLDAIVDNVLYGYEDQIVRAIFSELIVGGNLASEKSSGFSGRGSISSSGMGHIMAGDKTSKGVNIGKISTIFNDCGKKIQKGFQEYLKRIAEQDKIILNGKALEKFVISTESKVIENSTYNGASITFYVSTNANKEFTIPVESLLKMNTVQRERFFSGMNKKEKANFIRAINDTYKNYILNRCGCSQDSTLAKAIDKVINLKDPELLTKAFFNGMNTKDVTGILGEIQTIYFLLELGVKEEFITWRGGLPTGEKNRKPHQDLILNNKFGVQVKNTSKDINELDFSAGFQSFNYMKGEYDSDKKIYQMMHTEYAKEAMRKLNLPEVDDKLMEAIEQFIAMESFNIEYVRARERIGRNTTRTIIENKKGESVWKAIPGSNQQFAETRQEIETYAALAQQVMAAFASMMMYMQIGMKTPDTNTIYFAAGSLIMSAASIVDKMLKEWENIDKNADRSFKMVLARQGESEGLTIVDVINAGGTDYFNNIKLGFNSSYTFVKHPKS